MRSENKKTKTQAAAARHAVARLEQLEDRKYQSGNHDIGINVNDTTAAGVDRALPVLKNLDVSSVRLWYSVEDWGSRRIGGGLQRALDYHNAGYDVTLTIAIKDKQVPSTGEVRDWFAWAADQPALKKAVDRWEIGNEVDSANYFKGTLKQYVSNFLKPASDSLHAAGEKVISAGVSWNPEDVREMIGYGMLDMVDYVGFHPYAKGVKLQKQRIQEVNDVVDGRKPIVATEWNVRGYENNKSAWSTAVGDAYNQVHAGFALDYYFSLFVVDTPAGPAGLISKDGGRNTAFYNTFVESSHGVGSTPTTPTTPSLPPTTPPSSDNGNTASETETQIALYDATTDRVISGYGNLKANQVIDLADLPTHKLAIVVIPSKKASSVKMSLNGKTKIENTSPYAYFGENGGSDLKAGSLGTGSYSLKVTPYTADGAKGIAFASRTLAFKITDSDATQPTTPTKPTTPSTPTTPTSGKDADKIAEVTSYTLVDAKTGHAIAGYEHLTKNTTISLASLSGRSLALLANVDEDAKSVKVSVSGLTHIENTIPYAFFNDNHGKLATWHPSKGSYQMAATAYDHKNAKGVKGTSLSISLKFV